MTPTPGNDAPLLLTEIDPAGYALLTLNRPQAMNALSRGLMAALAAHIDALAANPAVRVLILTGAGRAFCAGLDLKEIGAGKGSLGRWPGDPDAPQGVAGPTATNPTTDPVAEIGRASCRERVSYSV